MKRLLLICLSLILLISIATSCNKNDDNDPRFSGSLIIRSKRLYMRRGNQSALLWK